MLNFRRNSLKALSAIALTATVFAIPGLAQAQSKVQLKTSMGDIVVELNDAKAPKSAANFLQYVRDKHYDGTVFHRVIDGFMIQGGGMDTNLNEKPTRAPIPLEASNGLKNDRGTIAMARTGNPNSATSQFFINVVNNDMLNAPKPDGHGYA
uniref:peptidylprolyl isomerase n=2 Tax=Comamonadaceae TaxID=80864 RepID=UPI000B408E99